MKACSESPSLKNRLPPPPRPQFLRPALQKRYCSPLSTPGSQNAVLDAGIKTAQDKNDHRRTLTGPYRALQGPTAPLTALNWRPEGLITSIKAHLIIFSFRRAGDFKKDPLCLATKDKFDLCFLHYKTYANRIRGKDWARFIKR